MKNHYHIDTLSIKNYKTIKSISLSPKKINLIIGKPNVGKSNFLESLSLLGGGYSKEYDLRNEFNFLSDLVRFGSYSDLFYFQNIKDSIMIDSNIGYARLRYHANSIDHYELLIHDDKNLIDELTNINNYNIITLQNIYSKDQYNINHRGFFSTFTKNQMANKSQESFYSPVKKYTFNKDFILDGKYNSPFSAYLNPPYGDNIFSILNSNPIIRQAVGGYFKEYKLDFLMDATSKKFEIQRRENDVVFRINYSLIADTLQRLIFLFAAIQSNENSIILLEEPEAHSFPPYVNELAKIISDSDTNQFFISTHSPYLLDEILKYNDEETLGIFVLDYENHETIIKEIPGEKFGEVMDMGSSFFFDLKKF